MKHLLFVSFITITNLIYCQESVYLIGNLDDSNLELRLQQFEKAVKKEENNQKYTLLILGDIKQQHKSNQNVLTSFIKKITSSGSQVLAVTGDHDWDNSGYHGLDSANALQKDFKTKIGTNIFIPKKNCPGPYIQDIGKKIRIIGINSQWWLHPYRKILPTDSECKNILKVQIIDELAEAIETAGDRKVIIMAHHPITSGGVYGGNSNLKGQLFPFSHNDRNNKTFLPIFGSFHHYYRQNVGSEQDFSSPEYKQYIKDIEEVLYEHQNVIICSSHEYDMQLLRLNNNYQLISGSFLNNAQVSRKENTIYKENTSGFVKLEIRNNHEVNSKFFTLDKKTNEFMLDQSFSLHDDKHQHTFSNSITAKEMIKYGSNDSVIGGDYSASKFKKIFFGSLYRDAWSQPVKIPTLSLDSVFGGLQPIGKGGGLQTISLKFIDKDGRKYAFRSIDKTPAKALPREFRLNLVKDITQDMTATQHPYGALFVSSLLNATQLYHGNPKLYIMPDSPILGKYRKQFSGMYGMLEPKPTKLEDSTKTYQNADQVKSSLSLFKKIYDSPKTSIDKLLYAKARVFDIFIGDWDRHQDNWKWIGFKDQENMIYKPYPKDRDHAFSQMNGLFYYIADREWAIAFRENFGYKYTGIKSLTIKASHMDRFLLSSFDKKDWLTAADQLNNQMTIEVIENAKKSFPREIQETSGKVIADKLKARKKGLNEAIEKYYNLLAKEVDVVGTNKSEYFEVNHLESGSVNVKMYPKHDLKNLLFDRTFHPNETKEIRLYGLAKRDSFLIKGNSKKSILVRIVGGDGKDHVIDSSQTKFGSKKTLIYDYPNGIDISKEKEVKTFYSEKSIFNEYDQERHKYDSYLPVPILVSNPDDGFGGGFILSMKKFGYANNNYKSIYKAKAFATTRGSAVFSLSTERNIDRTNLYFTGDIEYGNAFPFYSFYGTGNNTALSNIIEDAGFYKTRYKGAITKGGIIYRFFNKSYIAIDGIAEFLSDESDEISFFDLFPAPELQPTNAGGGEVKLDIDFRDSPTFTTRGIRIKTSHKALFTTSENFGKTSIELSFYTTLQIGIPITLGLKSGTMRVYGEEVPFYHLANIGQSNHLRGFLQNRFSGYGINYLNTDLRFHLGKTKSGFLPVYYGINLFSDVGQVVKKGNLVEKKWHNGYGGGIYITPISKEYVTLQFNVERSVEQSALFKIGLGVLL